MSNSVSTELLFAIGLVIVFILVTVVSVYVFVRQYKREKADLERIENEEPDA